MFCEECVLSFVTQQTAPESVFSDGLEASIATHLYGPARVGCDERYYICDEIHGAVEQHLG